MCGRHGGYLSWAILSTWCQVVSLTAHRDHYGEEVFDAGHGTNAPVHGRPYVTQISPRGGSLEGNISVLVSGAAFHDFGACIPTTRALMHILISCTCLCNR